MKSNQQKLKEMIRGQEASITDKELFLSSAYQNYQTSLAKAATSRYRRGLQVIMDWDDSNQADVAYTDNYKIHINAANPITQSFPSRFLRSQSCIGLTGHETGHLLYTDFTSLALYLQTLTSGTLYPEQPLFSEVQYQKNLEELMALMEEKDKATCLTFSKCASHISNILEDVFIEDRICENFPGSFRQGIQLNNLRFSEQLPSIQEQIDNDYSDFAVTANLIIAYCKTGTINNVSGYSGPYLDFLEDCIPYIEDAVYADSSKERFRAANSILVILWEYLKPMIERTREQLENQSETEAEETLEEELGEQIKSGSPLPSGKGGKMPANPPGTKSSPSSTPGTDSNCSNSSCSAPQKRQNDIMEAQKVVQEEGGRIALAKTSAILDENNPGVTYNQQYYGSGYEDPANDLFQILNGIAAEKANEQYQKEMTEELQKAAEDIHYGNAHTGIHININRMFQIPESMIASYKAVATPLLRASKRLQSSILPLLRDEAEGGKQKNLLLGKRLNMRSLYKEDGTIFTRTRLPSDEQKLAVGLLVDESGSMSYVNRITHAQKTAIVLYDFCISLGIPITIYGHSTGGSGVELYSYAEFDSVDQSDCYRLMDMSARNGNRDGAALRFVAEHLDKRPERKKLLIIISDGQPADYGYMGTEAEADLRGIKKEYEKKGIVLFAAAIGDDREQIKRIYKDGFLDITNLDELPKNMTLLVKQYLQ